MLRIGLSKRLAVSHPRQAHERAWTLTASLNNEHGGSSMENFKATVDAALNRLVTSEPRVPGIVAMAIDRQRSIPVQTATRRVGSQLMGFVMRAKMSGATKTSPPEQESGLSPS
jgi:hypothetical protein